MNTIKDMQTSKKKSFILTVFKRSGIFWALIIFCIIAAIISPFFLQPKNLINVLRQISINGIVSIGMTLVILTGGIDLSVGRIVGCCAVVCASIIKICGNIPLAIIAVLVLGIVLGSMNGIGVTKGKIPPFIMTLGMQVASYGLAMIISGGSPVSWAKTGIDFSYLGNGSFIYIPVAVWVYLIVLAIAAVILKYTRFGRYIYAIGDSREAARLSGIKVKKIEFLVYALMGFLCAVCAIMYISRLEVGEPTAGTDLSLDVIAMVVIGGTSINGGEGGVIGTMIGGAIIAVIANILNLIGVSPFIQPIVKGIIIILAVLIDSSRKK